MRVREDVGGGGRLTMDWKPARRVRRRLVPSNSATFTSSSIGTKLSICEVEEDRQCSIRELTGKQVQARMNKSHPLSNSSGD